MQTDSLHRDYVAQAIYRVSGAKLPDWHTLYQSRWWVEHENVRYFIPSQIIRGPLYKPEGGTLGSQRGSVALPGTRFNTLDRLMERKGRITSGTTAGHTLNSSRTNWQKEPVSSVAIHRMLPTTRSALRLASGTTEDKNPLWWPVWSRIKLTWTTWTTHQSNNSPAITQVRSVCQLVQRANADG